MSLAVRKPAPPPVSMPCTGLVLAGGRSSRMGRDKAMLPWRGRPLLEHMQQILLQAGVAHVAVSGPYPQYGGLVDPVADLGPLGGLLAAARVLEDGPLLVVPVDMPRLHASQLRQLLGHPAACVAFKDQVLPLRLALGARSRRLLERLCLAPPRQRSLRVLQQALDVALLPVAAADADRFAACNTPGQWEAMHR